MRICRVVLRGFLVASALTACFEEGGEEHQRLSAIKTAEGFIAFADISNNVTSDPVDGAAAGEALTKFLATPVAAQALLSPPFQFNGATEVEARLAASPVPAELPGCIVTTGESGCDSFATPAGTQCEAGAFNFAGSGSRMCPGCPDQADVFGACTYSWSLDVGFAAAPIELQFSNTTGTQTVTASEINGSSRFPYELTSDNVVLRGDIQVCACGPLTLDAGPPRKLVSGEFVVRDFLDNPLLPTRCARVTFTDDEPSAVTSCECTNGTLCPLDGN